jgi:hypothetical protein
MDAERHLGSAFRQGLGENIELGSIKMPLHHVDEVVREFYHENKSTKYFQMKGNSTEAFIQRLRITRT